MSLKIDQIADAIIAVPGVTVVMLDAAPGAQTTTSATFEDWAGASGSFVAQVAGTYVVQVSVDGYATVATAAARYRLVFDAATTIQYVGPDDDGWGAATDSSSGTRAYKTMTASVVLTAGFHTIKVQWKRSALTGTWNSDTYSRVVVRGTSVSGSGAGGNIVSFKAKTADQGSILVTTWTVLTELSHTFSVAASENLRCHYALTGYSSSASTAALAYRIDAGSWTFLEGGTAAASYWQNFTGTAVLRNLSAGPHTIDFGWYCNLGTSTVVGSYVFGTVTCSSYTCLWQDRGGLVPVLKDGTLVTSTPISFDFIGPLFAVASGTTGAATIQFTGVTPVEKQASSPRALLSTESGRLFTNEGAPGKIVLNLPAADPGLNYRFALQDPSKEMQVNAVTGDTVRIGGTVSSGGGYCSTTASGSVVHLTALNTTEWWSLYSTGTWTVS